MENTFGSRLKYLRKKKKLTQGELYFEVFGIKEKSSTVSNWEKDDNRPSIENMMELCNYLEVTPNYLLLGENEPQNGSVVMEDGVTYGITEVEQLRKENEELKAEIQLLKGKLEQANEMVDRIIKNT